MDVEKWIQENAKQLFEGHSGRWVSEDVLRALLNGRILCDAEPVAWCDHERQHVVTDAERVEYVKGRTVGALLYTVPLYKAAGDGEGL